ncbi:MAG TPA: proteasome activator [Dermatophilaceae bacterium]|nr:proteasome activator [Dermatophilaceae bacterium]
MEGMTDQPQHTGDQRTGPAPHPDTDPDRVVVITPDGMGVAPDPSEPGEREDEEQRHPSPADLVESPAKVMRIGSMIKQLLDEVRGAPLDEKGRARLADIHERSLAELKDGLAPELVAELERIALPFSDEAPSEAELRIAQAQLVGWLEGLFHGIQTALVAQQMAAQAQLQQMRQLPPGVMVRGGLGPQMPGGGPASAGHGHPDGANHAEGTGQYL